MENKLLKKLQNGDPVVGTFFHSGSCLIMEAIGLSGMDFVIIDKEHSPIGPETAADLIRAAEARGLTPIVRAKDASRPSILKMLDLGAKGLIVPALNGVEEVQKLVEYSKYPPVGNRGMAMGRGSDFGLNTLPLTEHWALHNEQTLMLPMCETVGFLENAETIAAMDGVDGIFIGPFDLSIALGMPGQFTEPKVMSAFERIVKACKDNGKICMIFSPNMTLGKLFLEKGFHGIATGIDVNLMLSSYRKIAEEFGAICNG